MGGWKGADRGGEGVSRSKSESEAMVEGRKEAEINDVRRTNKEGFCIL